MGFEKNSCFVLVALAALLAPFGARAQQIPQPKPAEALAEALVAACRQDETQFARFLTAENAPAFRALKPTQRAALMKRFVLLDAPGRPLLANDSQGHIVLRCEAPSITAVLTLGASRARENLAFVPVEIRGPGAAAGASPDSTGAGSSDAPPRRIEFGLVREGGGWRLLSVGLLLLDLPVLAQQWAEQEREAETQAREAAAIAALREIARAMEAYRRIFGRVPDNLLQLGPTPKGSSSAIGAGLLDADLASGQKGGYLFRMVIRGGAPEGEGGGFELAAHPAEYGKTGRRSFFLDSAGTLRGGDKQGGVATSADPHIPQS